MVGIFESTEGNTSSARVMFVLGLVWTILMTSVGLLWLKWGVGEAIAFFTATSGVFVTLKLGQKAIEKPSQSTEVKPTE
jgi:hypothetical protein